MSELPQDLKTALSRSDGFAPRNSYYTPPPKGLERLDVVNGTVVIQSSRLADNAVVRVAPRGKLVIVNPDGTEFVIKASDPPETSDG